MGCLVLLIIVIGLPAAEFHVLGIVAREIGFWDTVFLVVMSAVFGAYLARHQGQVVLARVQQCLAEGRVPTLEMVDGLLIFLGGLLFVFPGFISDAAGFILVFPLTRWIVRWLAVSGFKMKVGQAQTRPFARPSREAGAPHSIDRGNVTDAEVIE
jgi:UPF0716 protein FxsA